MGLINAIRKGVYSLNEKLNGVVEQSPENVSYLQYEINKWFKSDARKVQLKAVDYYENKHDILERERTIIGEDGTMRVVNNLPNNKWIDNQYAKMVDQKTNYLVGKPIAFESKNKTYNDMLKQIFNKRFMKTFRGMTQEAINGGLAYLLPVFCEDNELIFKKLPPYEVKVFWKDAEHTIVDFYVHYYKEDVFRSGGISETIEHIEVVSSNGVQYFLWKNGTLFKDPNKEATNHITIETVDEKGKTVSNGMNWARIPLIPFKFNDKEIPLIKRVKCLQDALNTLISDFGNNMQEDSRNTVLVVENYDGEDVGRLRHNLAETGIIKVTSIDGVSGGVSALKIEVNAENYQVLKDIIKQAIVDNARGYDVKDLRTGGTPNQLNIMSVYNDIDLDANEMETEFQASFEQLMWFVDSYLVDTKKGDFFNEEVNVVFNRDILVNESEAIQNCSSSQGIISNRTIVSNHPWVSDVDDELKAFEEEQPKVDPYDDLLNKNLVDAAGDGNAERID